MYTGVELLTDVVAGESSCPEKNLLELLTIYNNIKPKIEERLKDFSFLWKCSSDKTIFRELAFCILTPRSKAKICWKAVVQMDAKGVLFDGTAEEILPYIHNIRFNKNKAKYIVEARHHFIRNGEYYIKDILKEKGIEKDNTSVFEIRKWLSQTINGIGMKEASHFLRNISFGEDIAILDRHIITTMIKLGMVDSKPKMLSEKRYLELEERLRRLAKQVSIPMDH
ncbi:MAG: N-glycosylase/DNA lyase, partial [Thermoplasmata archaeon]